MSILTKTSVTQLALGDAVNPTFANAPHTNLETNIDDILSYINNSNVGQFEYDDVSSSGLNFYYTGGKVRKDNVVYTLAAGFRSLNASITSYIELTDTGTISHNTVGFTINYIPLWTVTTDATNITSVVDKRSFHSINLSGNFVRNDTTTTQDIGSNLRIGTLQSSGNEGGEIQFTKAPNGTFTSDPYLDVYIDNFRMVTTPSGVTKVLTFPSVTGTVWSSGNQGDGSGLDADTLRTYVPASASTVNTVVLRDGSGDINARLFRSEFDTTNGTIGYIMTQVDTATNNYLRPSTPTQVAAGMPVLRNDVTNTTGTFTNMYVDNSITSLGDNDTYMQFHAANQWRVVAANVEQIEVNATNGLLIKGSQAWYEGNMDWNTAGAIGSVALLKTALGGTAISIGASVSGANLDWTGLYISTTTGAVYGWGGTTAPSGTWMFMGEAPLLAGYYSAGIFVRIS